MTLPTKAELIQELVPPIDGLLAAQMIDEYISIERRFVLGDWEPAELDGGQFAEILSRILYHIDSGNLNYTRSVSDCLMYLGNDNATHHHAPRKELLHMAKVLGAVYKFRSDRGAVHISPIYEPNHMDSKLIIENVRWLFAETLRIFWAGDRNKVAKTIRELLQFDTPCVGIYGERTLVQRIDLKPIEEILILLHHAGDDGATRSELGKWAYCSASSVTTSLQKLQDSDHRQAVQLENGNYRLTDLGAKRVREELAGKLRIAEFSGI